MRDGISASPELLPAVPFVDVRDGGPYRLADEGRAHARALRDECIGWLPGFATTALPLIDAVTRRWLARSPSPYTAEVGAMAQALGFPGIWFLNGCYQWGCTARALEQDGLPWLARTLDWPFPGLGRHVHVARMGGAAGDYDNVTWPGYAGVLTASAPGRFAASINQAPMARRTRQPWLRAYDLAGNALRTWSVRAIPPDHLLRAVFETDENYADAKRRLETTPISRPAIYTLVGCAPGECCVIERTEDGCVSRDRDTVAANDWLASRPGWEARVGPDVFYTRSYEEAAENSRLRCAQLMGWSAPFAGTFAWLAAPVFNALTRVAVEMCPGACVLRAVGYERSDGAELPQPVTQVCELNATTA